MKPSRFIKINFQRPSVYQRPRYALTKQRDSTYIITFGLFNEKLFEEKLEIARNIDNNSEKLVFLTSILRSLLQSSVVVTFEITKALTPSDDVGLPELTERFGQLGSGQLGSE